jgi:hypothetical protein
MKNLPNDLEPLNQSGNSLYKIGGIAALLMVALIPIQSFIFIVYPPPNLINS